MSLASVYATAVAGQMSNLSVVEATKPAPFVGGAGLRIDVNDDGTGTLTFGQLSMPNVPAAAFLAIANWITTTFA